MHRGPTNPPTPRSAHLTASMVYIVSMICLPILLMALLGITHVTAWTLTREPHPWGAADCLYFYVAPAIPFATSLGILGALCAIIVSALGYVRRWIRFSTWTPVILSVPLALTIAPPDIQRKRQLNWNCDGWILRRNGFSAS